MSGAFRIEKDTMGEVAVAHEALWGAQTQRSKENFTIGQERFPFEFIQSYAFVKKAACCANRDLGLLDPAKATYIIQACDEIIAGQWADQFPLVVWQTGSGTQTNMNLNEVIANRAMQLAGRTLPDTWIHPNDDVNKGQSSNDTFPTVMHVSTAVAYHRQLKPQVESFLAELEQKRKAFHDIIKMGRTHLMDAVPLRLGDEFYGFSGLVNQAYQALEKAHEMVLPLAIGATAVGTGLNTHKKFGALVVGYLRDWLGLPFQEGANKFALLSGHEALVEFSGALKTLAVALMKIANDIRLLGSGPRAGLAELLLPENEPGSSIMPGKVNPTQSEALTMVCCQVIGNDVAVTTGALQGHFQLNVFKPLIIHNVLRSIRLLSDAMESFRIRCLQGIEPNRDRIRQYVQNSLMLVTPLSRRLGYEKAAQIAKLAHKENLSLKEAAIRLGYLSSEEFDQLVNPSQMLEPFE